MTKSERLKVRLKTVHIAWQVSGDTRHFGWPVPHPPPDNGFRGYTLGISYFNPTIKNVRHMFVKGGDFALHGPCKFGGLGPSATRRVQRGPKWISDRIYRRTCDAVRFRGPAGLSAHEESTFVRCCTDFIGASSTEILFRISFATTMKSY